MNTPPRTRGEVDERALTSHAARRLRALEPYIHAEIAGGVMLLAGTALGLLAANTALAGAYGRLLDARLSIDLAVFTVDRSFAEWVNDGLMTLFFFVVGLEIKREITHGELGSMKHGALPLAAAAGGMVVPAAFYLAFTFPGRASAGWGVPIATDIAFALGVLSLLGKRAPRELKIFLLALAAADDVAGVAVIAIFYAESIVWWALAAAVVVLAAVVIARRVGVTSIGVYALLGVAAWFFTSESGVHATIAGVALGLMTPARPRLPRETFPRAAEALVERLGRARRAEDGQEVDILLGKFEERVRATEEPLERIDRRLRPWVAYVVLPLFAFTNAGVSLRPSELGEVVRSSVAAGVFVALVAGKALGISAAVWAAVKLFGAELPPNVRMRHVVGIAILSGMGFTVSLFIAELAFEVHVDRDAARVAILAASLCAGALGYAWLRAGSREARRAPGLQREASSSSSAPGLH